MLKEVNLYSLDDVTIIPAVITDVEHRKDCDMYDEDHMLPIFTAPMSCVIDETNWEVFHNEGIHTIIPRSVDIEKRLTLMTKTWVAMGLDEFAENIVNINDYPTREQIFICIDIANGHMRKLIQLVKKAKFSYGDQLKLMVGNIANPYTYEVFARVHVDYIRLGIGSGNVCTTSANSGVHYPMASLINEITLLRKKHLAAGTKANLPKIIADGGFKNFDQINKALALGADYVMLGEIFAKTEEACGKEITNIYADPTFYPEFHGKSARKYYGMSTRKAQKEFGGEGNKTAEGIEKWVPIEYPLSRWVDNFKHWLREAMSLTNNFTLSDFKRYTELMLLSPQSYKAYFK